MSANDYVKITELDDGFVVEHKDYDTDGNHGKQQKFDDIRTAIRQAQKIDSEYGLHFQFPPRHKGLAIDMTVYHPDRDITEKEMEEFGDEFIQMAEKRGWLAGGGWHLEKPFFVDVNEDVYGKLCKERMEEEDL